MERLLWVRELPIRNPLLPRHAHTGDVLPDGSVLLLEDDMDRMGLEALRQWLCRIVVDQNATIVLARDFAWHR